MGKQYRSHIMASIHETAEDLYEAGLMEKRTMREFDEVCLTPISDEAETVFVGLLESHCQQDSAVKQLSNTFFDRIEQLKAKAKEAKQHQV
jgi:putative transcriptional regulator